MKTDLKEELAAGITNQIYSAYPTLWERFGERGYEHTKQDNLHHLDHLETAAALKQVSVFLDYTKWLQEVLNSRNVETGLIVDNFERLYAAIPETEEGKFMKQCLRKAIELLQE